MAIAKVYNGASWDTVIAKTYNGASWEDKAAFYDGVSWVALYLLCTAGTSAIPNLSDSTASGTPARTGAKWSSDNDVYTRTATTAWGAAISTWIGSCGAASYEGRWVQNSGDAPSSATGIDGVWHAMTTDVMVSYDTPADDITWSGSFTFELRRAADSVVILTDTFTMDAVEAAS